MRRIAKVGDVMYVWEDDPCLDDPQVQQRLRNIFDLAIQIGRRNGLFRNLSPLPEDKSEQEPTEGDSQSGKSKGGTKSSIY